MPMVLSYSGLRAPQFLWAIPDSKKHRLAKPLSRTHMAVGFQRRGGFDSPLKGRLRRPRRPPIDRPHRGLPARLCRFAPLQAPDAPRLQSKPLDEATEGLRREADTAMRSSTRR